MREIAIEVGYNQINVTGTVHAAARQSLAGNGGSGELRWDVQRLLAGRVRLWWRGRGWSGGVIVILTRELNPAKNR